MYVVNRTRGTYLGVNIRLAKSFWTRLLGLHAQRALHFGDGAWLVPCNSVHTAGLRWPLDLVFVGSSGRVVRIIEHVRPWRLIWPVPDAHSVLELPAGVILSSQTQLGDELEAIDDMTRAGGGRRSG